MNRPRRRPAVAQTSRTSQATRAGHLLRVACAGGLLCVRLVWATAGLGGGLLYVPVACDARRLAYSAVGWPATRRGWLRGGRLACDAQRSAWKGVAKQPALMRRR